MLLWVLTHLVRVQSAERVDVAVSSFPSFGLAFVQCDALVPVNPREWRLDALGRPVANPASSGEVEFLFQGSKS